MLHREQVYGSAEFPVTRGEWIAALYRYAEVVRSEVSGVTVRIDFRLPLRRFRRLSKEVKEHIRVSSD